MPCPCVRLDVQHSWVLIGAASSKNTSLTPFIPVDWIHLSLDHTFFSNLPNGSKYRHWQWQWDMMCLVSYNGFSTFEAFGWDTSVEHHRLHAIRCCCAGADCCLMAITWGAMIGALAAWPLQFKPIWRMKKTTANGMNNGTKGISPASINMEERDKRTATGRLP